jgi:hypothetical protein
MISIVHGCNGSGLMAGMLGAFRPEKRNGRLVVARRPSHTLTNQGRSIAASFFSHLPPVG